ncbi:MAG TPA: thioredoxin family protein [Vicinamibacterales bacterium]|nr:thioredoxin family protein [Vicinamibacterales bacterium]
MAPLQVGPEPAVPLSFYSRGQTLEQFVDRATQQRELWLKNAAWTNIPPELVLRLRRVTSGLLFLIVAEDWCPDSVNTVPYIVRLGTMAGVETRIVDRTVGQALMSRHPTPDGRTATPTVILLRDGRDVGAWVERPLVLQHLFLTMGVNPGNGRRLAERQSWYDADHGRTTLSELVSLAERTAQGK